MILLRETIVYSLLLHSNENLTSRVLASANSTFPVGKAISANCSFLCTGCCASPPPAPCPPPATPKSLVLDETRPWSRDAGGSLSIS